MNNIYEIYELSILELYRVSTEVVNPKKSN